MDTLTHALSGALLARATARQDAPAAVVGRRVAAGFLACAAPDLDFVVSYAGPVQYLLHHRGVTHSLLMLPLWALLFSWIVAKLLREPGGWRALYGVTTMALGLHIAGDVITSFGTMVLAPLSNWRAAIGTTFIIDLWFSGIIVAGLAASALARRSRLPAIAASLVLAAYVAFQAMMKHEAEDLGRQFAKNAGLSGARVVAQPRPVSPFNWTVFVSDDASQRFAHVNLARRQAKPYTPGEGFIRRLDAPYLPADQVIWVRRSRYGETPDVQPLAREAWSSPALGFFRWFAALPAFDGATEGNRCIWFIDLRFQLPGSERMPFPFGACRERPDAPWRAYERSGDSGKFLLD